VKFEISLFPQDQANKHHNHDQRKSKKEEICDLRFMIYDFIFVIDSLLQMTNDKSKIWNVKFAISSFSTRQRQQTPQL